MPKVSIGLVQMKMESEPAKNLQKAVKLIGEAARKGAKIVCLPELFTTRYFPQKTKSLGSLPPSFIEKIPGTATQALSSAARENKVTLIGGSVCEKAGNKFFNTSTIFDENGMLIGAYRKMHVPQDEYFFEKDYFAPGDKGFQAFKTRFGKIGALICYDQWFPEAARISALLGAEILFYPTAIGTVDGIEQSEGDWQDAWENVMRGHAIANGMVVATVNRVGREGKMKFWGGSFVCDAFGKTIARAGENEQILVCKVDLEHGKNVREGWRFFYNRRPEAYSRLTKR